MKLRSLFRRSSVLLGLLFGVAVVATGCTTDRAVLDQARGFHGDLQPAVMNDPELNNYLQSVGNRIIATAREMDRQNFGPDAHKKEDPSWMFSQNMQFHLVNSKTLNAFTTGGEHMYIYNELFQQCKTEDELAAVMAHEYAHVYARHVHKGTDRQIGLLGATAGAGVVGSLVGGKEYGQTYGAAAAGITGMAAQFVGMGFTRKDEREADYLGFNFYARSGWAPDRFGDFFQTMIDLGLDTGTEYLSDHPTLKSRVAAAKEWAAKLPPNAASWRQPPVADAQRFAGLKARAKQLGATLPSDQTLANSQRILAAMPRSCLTPTIPPDQTRARKELVQISQQQQQQSQRVR